MSKAHYNFKDRQCDHCGDVYTPTGHCSKYCSKKCRARYYYTVKYAHLHLAYRKDIVGQKIGEGSGGRCGIKNGAWKNGVGLFNKYSNRIKFAFQYCDMCHKDLRYSGFGEYCIHHKDGNHYNNKFNNFQLLCIPCHRKVHSKACKESSTTIPQGSRV